ADKQHDYTVTAVDVAGNTKAVAETVTIKTTLPNATAQLKDIQGFVTNQTTPTLTGQTEPKVHIQVDIAGKAYDTQADEKGLWSLPIPSVLAEGSHRFTVKVTDAAGNVGRFS
ncbi:Ig-like domain-containing protein, partial [Providencia rettgeri]